MATSTPITDIPTTRENRLLELIISTPKGAPYSATMLREERLLDANGNQIGDTRWLPKVTYQFNDIMNDQVTIDGTTLTVAQISLFIQAWCDTKANQIAS